MDIDCAALIMIKLLVSLTLSMTMFDKLVSFICNIPAGWSKINKYTSRSKMKFNYRTADNVLRW